MFRFLPIGLTLALVVAACGGSGKKAETTTTAPPRTQTVRVYFLRNGFVQPVARSVVPGPRGVPGTLAALYGGPTKEEQGELGLSTQVPVDDSYLRIAFSSSPGMLAFRLPNPTKAELAQLVYTLSQSPVSRKLRIDGKTYTRADFEDQTPAILVESPLPFTTVRSPLHLTGTANTFEATFQYELKDETGKVLAKHFVTATSGNGVRGTYGVSIPFKVSSPTKVVLTVYEVSAENGARENQVDIPLTLAP
jgi:hypothetical protein